MVKFISVNNMIIILMITIGICNIGLAYNSNNLNYVDDNYAAKCVDINSDIGFVYISTGIIILLDGILSVYIFKYITDQNSTNILLSSFSTCFCPFILLIMFIMDYFMILNVCMDFSNSFSIIVTQPVFAYIVIILIRDSKVFEILNEKYESKTILDEELNENHV